MKRNKRTTSRTRRCRAAYPLAMMLCAATLALTPAAVLHAETQHGSERVDFVEITPQARDVIERGMRYLAAQQSSEGSWGMSDGPTADGHVAITSLACIAFMADGHVPGRGRYGENVQRGLDYVLRHCTESGLIATPTGGSPMYGHGFATLFLGEIYGMTGDPKVRDALIKAVRLIVNSQNSEGGWRYQPVPVDADLSVTICQVMALRSARNAGIAVPKETIDRAIQYVKQSQNASDGGFRYMLNGGGSGYARTAAGVASLQYAGIYQDDAIERGLKYLLDHNQDSTYYFYGQYYTAQAMFLAGGDYWRQWYPDAREELLGRQASNGAWSGGHGSSYCTAMSLIVLQVPNRLLPIFQR